MEYGERLGASAPAPAKLPSIRHGFFRRLYGRWPRLVQSLCRAVRRQDADEPAQPPLILKPHESGNTGKERIVFSAAHIEPWFVPRTPLTNQNGPGIHQLACKTLYAEPLTGRVAPVYR